ncbi:MAG TPA: hypothetical protein P5013_01335 [Methanoregula sp.]|nr:hypothetical protein [Methanoregula sp.]
MTIDPIRGLPGDKRRMKDIGQACIEIPGAGRKNLQGAGISQRVLQPFQVSWSGIGHLENPANAEYFYTPLLPLERACFRFWLGHRIAERFYFKNRIVYRARLFS